MVKVGLQQNEVKIVPFQQSWAKRFQAEKAVIQQLGLIHVKCVEHVGSTSIPGMPAKPIVDILVGVDTFANYQTLKRPLKKIGYTFYSVPRRYQAFFFKKDDNDVATFHLKVVKYRGEHWNRYLHFREVLIKNKKYFNAYKTLKQTLATKYANNRKQYTLEKDSLIKKIVGK